MKFGYISYGKWTPAFQALTPEERDKEYDRIERDAEKHGLTLLMRGYPFGVSESLVFVYESDKGLENFMEFLMAVELPIMTDTRTNMVVIP